MILERTKWNISLLNSNKQTNYIVRSACDIYVNSRKVCKNIYMQKDVRTYGPEPESNQSVIGLTYCVEEYRWLIQPRICPKPMYFYACSEDFFFIQPTEQLVLVCGLIGFCWGSVYVYHFSFKNYTYNVFFLIWFSKLNSHYSYEACKIIFLFRKPERK